MARGGLDQYSLTRREVDDMKKEMLDWNSFVMSIVLFMCKKFFFLITNKVLESQLMTYLNFKLNTGAVNS